MNKPITSPLVRRIACLAMTLVIAVATPIGPLYARALADDGNSGSHCPQKKAPCPSVPSISCCCESAPATPVSGTPESTRAGLIADLAATVARDLPIPAAPAQLDLGPPGPRFGFHRVPLTVLLSTFLI